jgi:hypothetical protein
MAANPSLLQTLIAIMKQDNPPGFFLNKQFDTYKWAQTLFQELEDKRSSVTALTKTQANALGKDNLLFSGIKHESRLNALYRLIGLPSELALGDKFKLLDKSGNPLTNKDDLAKALLQREYDQLQFTFKQYLQSNSLEDLNAQINSTQTADQQLIAQLFDPNNLKNHTTRLFPIVQYSQIQSVVEPKNRISPPFASTEERYIGEQLMNPPFLESVITIRLLPQSGGDKINTQGAVEDAVIEALGFALGEIAKQYHRNQEEAEKHLIDGIALIRDKLAGVSSAALKKADLNANTRENDGIVTQGDIRSQYTETQINLYEAIISLLPLDNDIIPIGTDINGTPFQSRNIKENALTASFAEIIKSNLDALQRAQQDSKKVMQKRQLTQDKLTAELGSIIGEIGGVSVAEIVIVISALFVLDEEDLVGLISKSRFDQLISATNSNTSAASSGISDTGQANTAEKQINIFDILKQFQKTRTETTAAVQILQDVIKTLYDAFVVQLSQAHTIGNQ